MTTSTGTSLEYWLISIPNENQRQRTVAQLGNNVRARGLGSCYPCDRLPIGHLRVGTLDSLISLSDELGRIDAAGRTIITKLHGTYAELEGPDARVLDINRNPIRAFVEQFAWDEGHFDSRLALPQLVTQIQGRMSRISEQLRKQQSSLNELATTLQTVERKTSGSLMNKNLGPFIRREDWVEGEYLMTALIVIPKQKEEEFMSCYQFLEDSPENEKLMDVAAKKRAARAEQREAIRQQREAAAAAAQGQDDAVEEKDRDPDASAATETQALLEQEDEYVAPQCRVVVPDSAKMLERDDDFLLFRVILLRKGIDWFRSVCREKGYNVRQFSFDSDESKMDEANRERLLNAKREKEHKMKLFCSTNFASAFANWVHLKVTRAFVESVLRFGLPVDFSISVVKPVVGKEKTLLKSLESAYSHLGNKILSAGGGADDVDYSGLGTDFYPFVYVPLKIDL